MTTGTCDIRHIIICKVCLYTRLGVSVLCAEYPVGGTSTLPSYSIANHRQTLIRSGFGHQILTVTSKPKYWTNNKRHHDRWIASVNGSLVGIMKHSIYYGIILHILWYLGYKVHILYSDILTQDTITQHTI